MTRDQLEHAIRAACEVSGDTEVWVFGSQAILGEYPDAPESLCASIEVDIQPKNHPDKVDDVDGSLGEQSSFHASFGFYVHGVSIAAATLPSGWQSRVIPVMDEIGTRGKTGLCVEAHDLAASKLAAYREKDRNFVRALLKEGLVQGATLRVRLAALNVAAEHRIRLLQWLDITLEELS